MEDLNTPDQFQVLEFNVLSCSKSYPLLYQIPLLIQPFPAEVITWTLVKREVKAGRRQLGGDSGL